MHMKAPGMCLLNVQVDRCTSDTDPALVGSLHSWKQGQESVLKAHRVACVYRRAYLTVQ